MNLSFPNKIIKVYLIWFLVDAEEIKRKGQVTEKSIKELCLILGMNPLKRGFLETIKAIKENKLLFIILIFIQILFISSILFVGINYQLKLYENIKGITEPLESIDYGAMEKMGEEGLNEPLLREAMGKIMAVEKSYKEMTRTIWEMVFLMLGCFLAFNGLGWSLANYMVKKGKLLFYWGKFVLVSLAFLGPAGLISYGILKSLMGGDLEVFGWGFKGAGVLFLIAGYFMIIGFCLLNEKTGELFKKIFLIGIKKIHWVLLSGLLVLAGMGAGGGLAYWGIGKDSLGLAVLGAVVLVLVWVMGKIFLTGVVNELNKQ